MLVQYTGSYPTSSDLPTTLFNAFDRLGLATPPPNFAEALDRDPSRAVEQALWLLGVAANRLRNAEGVGHGRPFSPKVNPVRARVVARSMGVVSQLLLDALEPSQN